MFALRNNYNYFLAFSPRTNNFHSARNGDSRGSVLLISIGPGQDVTGQYILVLKIILNRKLKIPKVACM